MANFSYVIDSSFSPFSMQEMLVPFTAYKDAFEKTEEAYNDLSDKSDKFKYLSEKLPEGSKARQIYEGYANDLRTQAEDLAHNGLSMSNRRALTSMKRRYAGEIGRLSQADEAMKEEKKIRQTLNAQDSSRLYAVDNLSIDEFLDGNNPNLYSVSGNELYTRGAAAGKAASSRIFSAGDAGSTLNGYYRDYVQKMGYSAETIRQFYQDMSAIPELQMAADAILEERGVNQNLTGVNLQRARQSVINGMIDGAVYSETHNPQRDLGVLTKAEEVDDERAKVDQNLRAWSAGATIDENGNVYGDTNNVNYKAKDIANQAAEAQFNVMFPIAKEDITDEDGNIIVKAGDRVLGESYKVNKNGKVVKANSSEDDTVSAREKALVGLPSTSLDDPKGFYVTDTDNHTRVHYMYIASVTSNSDGTEYKSKDFITGKDKIYGRRVLSDTEVARLPTALWEKIIATVQEKTSGTQEKTSGTQNLPEYRVVECINKRGEKHYSIAIITN